MRRKIGLLVSIILIMSLLIGIMVACSDDTNNDNTDIGDNSGGSIGSEEVDDSAKVISITGGKVEGMVVSLEVAPEIEEVELSGMLKVSKNSSWQLYADKKGQILIPTKYASDLEAGTNLYYIVVNSADNKVSRTYTLNIFRNFYATIRLMAQGQVVKSYTALSGTTIQLDPPSEIAGYDLTWNISSYYVTEPVKTFTATTITPKKYTITLDSDGGDLIDNKVTATYNETYTLPIPTKVGHTFAGWYYEEKRITYNDGVAQGYRYAQDVTYKAHWKINSYNVMVKSVSIEEGTVNNISGEYDYNTSIELKATPNNGYYFDGWYLDSIDGKRVSDSANYFISVPACNVTYIAKFVCYRITTNTNLLGAGTYTEYNDSIVSVGEEVTLTAISNIGYTWLGWYNNDTKLSKGTDLTYTFTMENNNITYTAKWCVVEEMSNFDFVSTTATCTITGIRDYNIIEIIIPTYVTNIGSYAFSNCSSLKSITIPASVTDIGSYAFSNCPIVYADIPTTAISHLPKNTLQEIIINSGTMVESRAFYDCSSLILATISASVTSIGDFAFNDCNKLTNVIFERNSKLSSIGAGAFCSCDSLTSIIIPANVTNIGSLAFSSCYKLVEVYNLSSLNITKGSVDNGNVGEYALDIYTSLDTLSKVSTDENGYIIYIDGEDKILVGYIGTSTELTLPTGITRINKYAFCQDENIASIIIPASVTSIGSGAFYNCYKLVEVYNLSSLNITKGSTRYGYVGCYALDVYTSLDTPSKLSTDENGYIIYTDGEDKILVGYTGTDTELTLPGGITEIYEYAFYGNDNITSVTIPASVTSIGSYAFEYCSKLNSITIPASVTSIGNYAFYGCDKLVEVYNLSSLNITAGSTSYGYVGYYADTIINGN